MTDRLSDYDALFLLVGTVLAIVFGQSLLIAWLISAWRRDRELRETEERGRRARLDPLSWFGATVRLFRRGQGNK